MSTEEEIVTQLKEKVLAGKDISREEALFLSKADLTLLSAAADEIRKAFFQDDFDMCAVISAKSGKCSENCRFCSQACVSKAEVAPKPLVTTEELTEIMELRDSQHIRRFCVVSVGRKMGDAEIDQLCESLRIAHEGKQIALCASLGLLDEQQFLRLKEAGVTRVHNNLETSERFFPTLCTSHTYQDKIETVRAAKRAGLEVCCGGIFGVGETMEDRIDMALTIRGLDVRSVPVNMLDPVPGTDYGETKPLTKDEVQRIMALYRFILPKIYVRLAAGREYLDDGGLSCFHAGCNATITGDMLTVRGAKVTVEQDMSQIRALGYVL